MLAFIKNELKRFNIDLVSCISLEQCEINRSYLLEKRGIETGSVVIFAVPYLSREALEQANISAYAVCKDYHAFFASVFETVIPKLEHAFPENKFAGFVDHSPINEIIAAANAGLGIIGRHGLLITRDHSSYIFLGEIIVDASLASSYTDASLCSGCNSCAAACPVGLDKERCLSALTQRKGELNTQEKEMIRNSACAWGCDICQRACPHTRAAIKNETIYTNIDYFKEDITPRLTSEDIESMPDSVFKARAYSWRGKATIKRNLEILEGKES